MSATDPPELPIPPHSISYLSLSLSVGLGHRLGLRPGPSEPLLNRQPATVNATDPPEFSFPFPSIPVPSSPVHSTPLHPVSYLWHRPRAGPGKCSSCKFAVVCRAL
jgi:hypothetical protein